MPNKNSSIWKKFILGDKSTSDNMRAGEGRDVFQRDYDRIIFSNSFRRLAKKTQVHPFAINDHMHTRLTHSIETVSVGRSLGILVGEKIESELPDFIKPYHLGRVLQAACAAHDIGNPPFGHAGENSIKSWFEKGEARRYVKRLKKAEVEDLRNFEGNAQGFRLLTRLESYGNFAGMGLTNATLGAFLKYPWTLRAKGSYKKRGVFLSEANTLKIVGSSTGMFYDKKTLMWSRHPLAYLTEAADDICYNVLDLEDAYEMRILSFKEITDLLKPLAGDGINKHLEDPARPEINKVGALRSSAIHQLVLMSVRVFIERKDDILNGKDIGGSLIELGEFSGALKNIKAVSNDRIYEHKKKVEVEIGSEAAMGILLETFFSAVKEYLDKKGCHKSLSSRSRKLLSLMSLEVAYDANSSCESYRRAIDFISSMTDDYAVYLAKQFSGLVK